MVSRFVDNFFTTGTSCSVSCATIKISFILQMALVILDPNLVFVSILDRFQLLQYFSGAILHEAYEGPHLSSMVEELFYVLITVVSEEANATKMPLPAQVRREIVHALAMGPCSYTDLTKRVAERMAEDVCFERVLSETANFKAPESTADFGMYELKDEAYDEVNPFYFHYARNRREEVENVLKARLKKKNPSPANRNLDPVIVPKPWKCELGPFKNLHTVFESDVLLQIIFYGLHNILVLTNSSGESPPSAEAILDQVLHLVMLALVNHGAAFSLLSSSKTFDQITLLDVICALEHHDKFKPYKARAEWIISQYYLHVPEEVQRRRKVEDAAMAPLIPRNQASCGTGEERGVDEAVQGPTGELRDQLQRGRRRRRGDAGRDGCPRVIWDVYRLPGGT
jgi:E3 ubiquitin-protein ligase UBR1